MQRTSRIQGFTLIELLTVIAIIAILAAILFPTAATVREQARASDCMSKLHQIYVSTNVYRQDEGAYPPALMGVAEVSDGLGGSTGVYLTDPASQQPASLNRIINGYLYPEQTKNSELFRCPDNTLVGKTEVVLGHFPASPPPNWPAGMPWIATELANYGCPTDAFGTIDCFVGGPYDKLPKYYYRWDSYDVGPAVDAAGSPILLGGQPVYVRHYSTDWTGVRGAADLPNQLKYTNPPDDKTLLAYCTWHARTAKTGSTPTISMAGVAKKLDLKKMLDFGPNILNQ